MHSHHCLLVFGFFTSLFVYGCAKPEGPNLSDDSKKGWELSQWVGESVRIQFRRDALGAAAALPVSPTTGSINGASTSMVGTLELVDSDAIVVKADNRPRWVPREVILFVERNPDS